MELFLEICADAFLDTARMLPFLFAAYLLMEYLEHRGGAAMQRLLAGTSRYGSVVGGLLGSLPQCGFSVAAASLFNRRLITMGTLLSVFISTSDEALPMLLSSPDNLGLTLRLIGVKLVLGISAGLLLDMVLRNKTLPALSAIEEEADQHGEHCHCNPNGHTGQHILLTTLGHTLSTAAFIFVVSLALGGAIALAGEENIASLLMTGSLFQPMAAALVGFIPNCAASVVLTRLLMDGAISFGSAIAGLTTGAGVGLLVLVRGSRSKKELGFFLLLLYVIGAGAGMVLQLL
ncbi:MAG: putative manganese transporter [Angelakisella sp.]